MRLKVGIWVKAYLRICAREGAQAVVVRHGDDDAGAVFIKVNRLDGTARLYGPAPAGLDGLDQERAWIALGKGDMPEQDVDARLVRERDFDGDLWVIEVEDRAGRHFLGDWLVKER